MKKFGRFLTFLLVAGTAAAGIYYYFKSREDDETFEDSDNDVNDDLEEFLRNEEKEAESAVKREYVPLKFEGSDSSSGETVNNAAETATGTAEAVADAAESVTDAAETAKNTAEASTGTVEPEAQA